MLVIWVKPQLKTTKIIDECIGGVLFIDEAYSLASNDNGDSFSKECLDTLCEKLSDHKNDLMVIIAGYEDELKNTFFKVNKGLESTIYLEIYYGQVRCERIATNIQQKGFRKWLEITL